MLVLVSPEELDLFYQQAKDSYWEWHLVADDGVVVSREIAGHNNPGIVRYAAG